LQLIFWFIKAMLVFLLNSIHTLTKEKKNTTTGNFCYWWLVFLKSEKKKEKTKWKNGFCNFFIQKAMQLYFKSPIAPSMLLYRWRNSKGILVVEFPIYSSFKMNFWSNGKLLRRFRLMKFSGVFFSENQISEFSKTFRDLYTSEIGNGPRFTSSKEYIAFFQFYYCE